MNKQASISRFLRALTIAVLSLYGNGLPTVAQVATPAWSSPASTIVTSEEKEFQNGNVHLCGTLYLPGGPKPVPCVIVFHSASSATQDLPLYQHLKELLPALGYAVFIYDRRGSGKSAGKRAGADFNTLADDGLAALRMLAADKRINARKIGFWGLSQGGWLSVLAASRSRQVAFAISISAPLTAPDVQMNFAVGNILRVKGFRDEDIGAAIRTRIAVDDFMRGKGDRLAVERMLADAVKKPWFKYCYISPMLDDPVHSQWAKEIALDPIATLERVSCPVLILFGANDPWVPVKISTALLGKMADKKANLTYAVIAGANHEMATNVAAGQELNPSNATAFAPDSPSYFGLLAKWLSMPGQRPTLH
ncbi:alpha/beta hydrolase family protein [Chitinophaga barathri]|uniref:Alpha/beta fold hydrolase n=1 Tax=Chitinophaga barathri TaxID=1647451 RepID=A0A3N4MHK1_9BACT|nr:alpha/beta fold hydrolase [Chitinophaga barathri]RPD39570.1 alpha/beta fold hydrolase [Chitinophaga barathri]